MTREANIAGLPGLFPQFPTEHFQKYEDWDSGGNASRAYVRLTGISRSIGTTIRAFVSSTFDRTALVDIPAVQCVHDLHIWTITSGMYALSCHVTVESLAFSVDTLEEIRHLIHARFDIAHQTIQLETPSLALCDGEHF